MKKFNDVYEATSSFTPIVERRRLPRIQLSLSGRFQITNALSALGLALAVGADPEGACLGIAGFVGVRRRFEMHEGKLGGRLINDYAHHPSEIRAVLHAARRRFPGARLVVAFQPHQHQRTFHLLEEFAAVLAEADRSFVLDIYGARESAEIKAKVCALDLVRAVQSRGGVCELGGTVDELPRRLRELCSREDLLLILGAGDIDKVVEEVVAVL